MKFYQRTELHRHLELTLRLSSLRELGIAAGLWGESTSETTLREKYVLTSPHRNLREVLAKFSVFQRVLVSREALERLAYEAVENAVEEGLEQAEFRYSPEFLCEHNSLSWVESLESLHRGLEKAKQKFPSFRAGFILIAVRESGPDHVAEVADFYLDHKDKIAAFDLAGNEDLFPCRNFVQATAPLRRQDSGAKITIHAGEGSGPENVWEAIELLGAQRIGHGFQSIGDPKLVDELVKRRIPLELCPTSNWLTCGVSSLSEHPLPRLLRRGVVTTINTDDPVVFGTTYPQEVEIAKRQMGLTEAEIETCEKNAFEFSFLSSDSKKKLKIDQTQIE